MEMFFFLVFLAEKSLIMSVKSYFWRMSLSIDFMITIIIFEFECRNILFTQWFTMSPKLSLYEHSTGSINSNDSDMD